MARRARSPAKPTIARVHGPAFARRHGAGGACDIAIGSAAAEFCFSRRSSPVAGDDQPVRGDAAPIGERAARRYSLTGGGIRGRGGLALRSGCYRACVSSTSSIRALRDHQAPPCWRKRSVPQKYQGADRASPGGGGRGRGAWSRDTAGASPRSALAREGKGGIASFLREAQAVLGAGKRLTCSQDPDRHRGEIACRVIRTGAGARVRRVAVYCRARPQPRPRQGADEALRMTARRPQPKSYLNGEGFLPRRANTGAGGDSPGLGFLALRTRHSRRPAARQARSSSGPSPDAIARWGTIGRQAPDGKGGRAAGAPVTLRGEPEGAFSTKEASRASVTPC